MPAAGEEIFEFRAGLTAWHRAGAAAGASQGLQQAVPQRDPRVAQSEATPVPFVDGAARVELKPFQVQFFWSNVWHHAAAAAHGGLPAHDLFLLRRAKTSGGVEFPVFEDDM